MHLFPVSVDFRFKPDLAVSPAVCTSHKRKKIPQTSQYGLPAGSDPHLIYSFCAIQGRLHNTLSQHSLNHLLKSGDISTSHIVACNLIALCCL